MIIIIQPIMPLKTISPLQMNPFERFQSISSFINDVFIVQTMLALCTVFMSIFNFRHHLEKFRYLCQDSI